VAQPWQSQWMVRPFLVDCRSIRSHARWHGRWYTPLLGLLVASILSFDYPLVEIRSSLLRCASIDVIFIDMLQQRVYHGSGGIASGTYRRGLDEALHDHRWDRCSGKRFRI
jgi:hypothetical protein